MKSKVAFLSLVSLLFTFAAVAQEVESDDMYFNSKDRVKLNLAKASKKAEYTASIKKSKKEMVEEEAGNPTDSYSARNVNPEYEARTNAQSAQSDNQDYFVNNYRYNNSSNLNTWNNNFNNRYNNPWYSANYWGPSINSWNSPYYGSYYDSWGNPWANPYYQSGWSSSFSYHWGNSYNYGWGMGLGYGNPYYGYGYNNAFGYSPWNSYYGYGSGYGYPTQIVVIENGTRYSPVYGKRNSRSSEMNREYNNGSTRSNNRGNIDSGNGRPVTGGRTSTTASTPSRQSDYYNRGWRNQSENTGSGSGNSGNTNTRSSWENSNRSSWRESSGGSTYTPSPSRSSGGFDSGRSSSGGGSSSGGSSGGSSSGSRSGGRGH